MARTSFTPAQDALIVAAKGRPGASTELARLLGVPASAIYSRRQHLTTYKPSSGKRGRKPVLTSRLELVRALAQEPTMSKTAAARALSVTPATLDRYLQAHGVEWDGSGVRRSRPVTKGRSAARK